MEHSNGTFGNMEPRRRRAGVMLEFGSTFMQSGFWKTESTADGTDYSNRAGNYLRCLGWINLLSLNLLAGFLYFYLGNEIKNHRNRPRIVALWLCGLVILLSVAALCHIAVYHPGYFQIQIFRITNPHNHNATIRGRLR